MTVILSMLLWLLLAGSQDPSTTAQAPATAEIHGRVIEKETGRPIARAVVRLAKMGGSGALTMQTDDEGRFLFAGLAPGSYGGFVDDRAHQATHVMAPVAAPGGRGPITLKAGEILKDVDVALERALAITVRVVDEWGEPLSELAVTVKSAVTGAQVYGWSQRTTDDRGRLRIFKLPPGRYIVCAEGGQSPFISAGPPTSRDRLIRTCFPSVSDESEAARVVLQGADVDGLEIVMRRGRTYSISGIVLDASGTPVAGANVGFHHYIAGGGSTSTSAAGADGRFVVGNIPPGDYAIEASVGGPNRPEQRRENQVAYQPVHVGASDVEGVVVAMTRTVDVAGRFVLEDPSAPLPRPDGSGLMVAARLAGSSPADDGGIRPATAGQDREFLLTAMFGRRTLEFLNVPRGWYVKSVRYAGKEIIDTATEFKAGSDPSALEVVLSNRGAVIAGRVLDDAGNPVPGARILVVEVDPTRQPRYLEPAATASATGTFRTGPRRPGDYLIVALGRNVAPPRADDRERRAALFEGAERVTLLADEERALDVRVARVK